MLLSRSGLLQARGGKDLCGLCAKNCGLHRQDGSPSAGAYWRSDDGGEGACRFGRNLNAESRTGSPDRPIDPGHFAGSACGNSSTFARHSLRSRRRSRSIVAARPSRCLRAVGGWQLPPPPYETGIETALGRFLACAPWSTARSAPCSWGEVDYLLADDAMTDHASTSRARSLRPIYRTIAEEPSCMLR